MVDITNIISNAETYAGYLESSLKIAQRKQLLIIRTVTDTVIPATVNSLERTEKNHSSLIFPYVKVSDVPLKYLNITFSDSNSGMTVVKSDNVVTISRQYPTSIFKNTVPGNIRNRYTRTFFLAPLTTLPSEAIIQGYSFGVPSSYLINTDYLPNDSVQYELIGLMENRQSLYELLLRGIRK